MNRGAGPYYYFGPKCNALSVFFKVFIYQKVHSNGNYCLANVRFFKVALKFRTNMYLIFSQQLILYIYTLYTNNTHSKIKNEH